MKIKALDPRSLFYRFERAALSDTEMGNLRLRPPSDRVMWNYVVEKKRKLHHRRLEKQVNAINKY